MRLWDTNSGVGTAFSEANLQAYYLALSGASFVFNGFQLHSDGAGLDIDVRAGIAMVNGYRVQYTTNVAGQALTGTATNYVFLNPDGTLEIETTGTPTDSNALLLGKATTDASSVTGVTHAKNIVNGRNILIRKASDQAYTSGTPDTDFTWALNAREVWSVFVCLIVTQDESSGDLFVGWDLPSGGVIHGALGPDSSDYTASTKLSGNMHSPAYDHTSQVLVTNQVRIDQAAIAGNVVHFHALIHAGATSGTTKMRWTRAGAASTTTVKAGSYLYARRI